MKRLLKAAYKMRQLQSTPVADINLSIFWQIQFWQLEVDQAIAALKAKIDLNQEMFYQEFLDTIIKVRELQESLCTYQEFKADTSYFTILSWLDTLLFIEFELEPNITLISNR